MKLGETGKTANFAFRVALLDQKANQFQNTSSGSDVLKVYPPPHPQNSLAL